MSILEDSKEKYKNSKVSLELICDVYLQFDCLIQKMQKCHMAESLFYIQLARKCFQEKIEKNYCSHQ